MTKEEQQLYWQKKASAYAETRSKGEPTYFRDALYVAYMQAIQDALKIRLI